MAKIQGVHVPAEIKNLAINGAFDFWQRVEGNTTTYNTASQLNSSTNYVADMFPVATAGSTVKNFSVQRTTDVPSQAQSGYQSTYSWLYTQITGISTFAAGDYIYPINYKMEGQDYAKIHGKTATFGFWIKASIAGTYSLSLNNSAFTRSYVTTFTVSGANTWQFITLLVQMDTSAGGTWTFDNNLGLYVGIGAVAGTTFQTSTVNQWQNGYFISTPTTTNFMATAGATFELSQFSIVEGPLGFAATGFQRAGKDIQQELAMCQRYYEKSYDQGTVPGTATQTGMWAWSAPTNQNRRVSTVFAVKKRAVPTPTVYSTQNANQPGKVSADVQGDLTISSYQCVGTSGLGYEVVSNTTDPRTYCQWTAEAGL